MVYHYMACFFEASVAFVAAAHAQLDDLMSIFQKVAVVSFASAS